MSEEREKAALAKELSKLNRIICIYGVLGISIILDETQEITLPPSAKANLQRAAEKLIAISKEP